MTKQVAKSIALALGVEATLIPGVVHDLLISAKDVPGDKVARALAAIEETFPGIDSDYAYETAFHAIHG